VLVQRIGAIHCHLPHGQPLRVGLYVRRPPPFAPGTALILDWSARFADKEATPETWRDALLPALERIAKAIRQHAPGREIEAFGLPTLPAAAALGCAFLSTTGLRASGRTIRRRLSAALAKTLSRCPCCAAPISAQDRRNEF
jgi:hypothetical protein